MERTIWVLVAVVVAVVACFVLTFRRVPTTEEAFFLSSSEVLRLEEDVRLHKNKDSAIRLADFYFASQDDRKKAIYWYEIAAELGDPKARANVEKLRAMK